MAIFFSCAHRCPPRVSRLFRISSARKHKDSGLLSASACAAESSGCLKTILPAFQVACLCRNRRRNKQRAFVAAYCCGLPGIRQLRHQGYLKRFPAAFLGTLVRFRIRSLQDRGGAKTEKLPESFARRLFRPPFLYPSGIGTCMDDPAPDAARTEKYQAAQS